MPILMLIMSIIGAAAFWWWRAQRMRDAADTIIDMAGHAKGAYSRHRFKSKAGASVLAGVDDPGSAAAVLLYSVAALKGPAGSALETRIAEMLHTICRMAPRDIADAAAFAPWAAQQIPDTNAVIRRLLPLWEGSLGDAQREELIGMASEVANFGSPANDAQLSSIRRLREALFPR
jgi:hypothetical protein